VTGIQESAGKATPMDNQQPAVQREEQLERKAALQLEERAKKHVSTLKNPKQWGPKSKEGRLVRSIVNLEGEMFQGGGGKASTPAENQPPGDEQGVRVPPNLGVLTRKGLVARQRAVLLGLEKKQRSLGRKEERSEKASGWRSVGDVLSRVSKAPPPRPAYHQSRRSARLGGQRAKE
jgi:hypothetical protein